MIHRLVRYVGVAYPPAVWVPFTALWAVGLTALFAAASGEVASWSPDGELLVTVVTLVVGMALARALDDIRDLDYDREHNPQRPLPSGLVRQRDLLTMVGVGTTVLLLLNAGRGVVLLMLVVAMAYFGAVILLDRFAGWPNPDRLWLAISVNLPVQGLLSLYVYAGFLRAEDLRPSPLGLVVVAAILAAAMCLELGRKVTRRPRPGERTYVTVLGASGTSVAGLAAAVTAAVIVLLILTPWQAGHAWGWLVLVPLALPAVAVARFAAGAARWPVGLTIAYVPVVYASFLAVGALSKGALG